MAHYAARMWYGSHAAIPWLGWVGPILMILVWAAIITAVVFLIRYLVRQSRHGSKADAAMEILRSRYARGEVSKEQFEEMRKLLL